MIQSSAMNVERYMKDAAQCGKEVELVELDGYSEPLLVEMDLELPTIQVDQQLLDALDNDYLNREVESSHPVANWYVSTGHGSDTFVDYSTGDHGLGMVCAQVEAMDNRMCLPFLTVYYPVVMPFGAEPYPSDKELLAVLKAEAKKRMKH